jgi:hypothetical protein
VVVTHVDVIDVDPLWVRLDVREPQIVVIDQPRR